MHIETAVREISKNVARMVVCIWLLVFGNHGPGFYIGAAIVYLIFRSTGEPRCDRELLIDSLAQPSGCAMRVKG